MEKWLVRCRLRFEINRSELESWSGVKLHPPQQATGILAAPHADALLGLARPLTPLISGGEVPQGSQGLAAPHKP